MESSNLKFALYGGTNECSRSNTLLLPLSEVSAGAVSLVTDGVFTDGPVTDNLDAR